MSNVVLHISRSKADAQSITPECHVLTYAEAGFSPLDTHARRLGISSSLVQTFAKSVNERSEVGSMHPVAPISAVPRYLVRESSDGYALAVSIGEFLKANRDAIKARRLIFDFRMPSVPNFAIQALKMAIDIDHDSGLDEVLVPDW